MKNNKWTKINIVSGIVLVILIVINVYVFVFHGAVPEYYREELGVYIPYLKADEYIDESSFTDSLMFYRFELNKYETDKLKADIENNPAWHRYSGETEDLLSLIPNGSDTYKAVRKIDFSNCMIALYDFYNDCFVYETDGLNSFFCAVYDENLGMYYCFEMMW